MQIESVPERYVPMGKRPRNCEVCGDVYYSNNVNTKTHPGKCAYEYRSQRVTGGMDIPATTKVHPEQTIVQPAKYERVMFWPDTHLPYQDKRAVELALKIAEYFKPDRLVMLGDILDCSGFSRFDFDATDPKSFLQTELDEWHSLARSITSIAPNATKTYIRGNHEARVQRWLWKNPQLKGFEGVDLAKQMRLEEHGFDPEIKDEIELCEGSLTVRHGTYLGGSFSGAAARQEMAKAGTSGISGHTHRASQYIQRDKRGLRVWIECGHLAENPPHYAPATQNWCQAVTVGELARNGNDFSLELVPFRLSYKARVFGKELST